jgi:hypothetical protein
LFLPDELLSNNFKVFTGRSCVLCGHVPTKDFMVLGNQPTILLS